MESSPSIAIIGGGPSGLVFARLLELNGITDYVVYEQDQSATPGQWQQGGTLDLHGPSGQLALKRAGLFDEFSTKFARWDASCFRVLDPDGGNVFYMEGRDAPEIDRLQLRQLLLDSVPAHKVRWGSPVASVEKIADNSGGDNNKGYTIHFADGTLATGFCLVVGADGAWSKVRPLLTQARPIYSGKMFIEGIISHNNPCYDSASELAGPGSMVAIGTQKMLSLQKLSDGTYRIYSGLIVPEDFYSNKTAAEDITKKSEAVRSLLLSSDDFFPNWAPHLRAFVENAEGPFRSWPLHRLDPEAVGWKRSVAPGVTLLGDAAHVSTPFVGEGVNCSLYDSVVLADSIVTHCGKGANLATCEAALETALAAYEEDMFARGRDLIQRSTGSENLLFAEDAPKQFMNIYNNIFRKDD